MARQHKLTERPMKNENDTYEGDEKPQKFKVSPSKKKVVAT